MSSCSCDGDPVLVKRSQSEEFRTEWWQAEGGDGGKVRKTRDDLGEV